MIKQTKIVRIVANWELAELLEEETEIAKELASILTEAGSIEDIIQEIKCMSEKKKYKLGGKNKIAVVISKAKFMLLCSTYLSPGISANCIDKIEHHVCLTQTLTDFYVVKSLENLFDEVNYLNEKWQWSN